MRDSGKSSLILAQIRYLEREKFSEATIQKFDPHPLSFKWDRPAWRPQTTSVAAQCRNRRLGRFRLPSWGLTLRDLPFHALHEHHKLFRFMVSFRLLAHPLEVLRSIADTIRHRGFILGYLMTIKKG
jgi:hypothetical protein